MQTCRLWSLQGRRKWLAAGCAPHTVPVTTVRAALCCGPPPDSGLPMEGVQPPCSLLHLSPYLWRQPDAFWRWQLALVWR